MKISVKHILKKNCIKPNLRPKNQNICRITKLTFANDPNEIGRNRTQSQLSQLSGIHIHRYFHSWFIIYTYI